MCVCVCVCVCVSFPLASLTESCSLLDGLKDFFLLQQLSLTLKLITSEVVQGTSIRMSVYGHEFMGEWAKY